jgi:hypothetical protein
MSEEIITEVPASITPLNLVQDLTTDELPAPTLRYWEQEAGSTIQVVHDTMRYGEEAVKKLHAHSKENQKLLVQANVELNSEQLKHKELQKLVRAFIEELGDVEKERLKCNYAFEELFSTVATEYEVTVVRTVNQYYIVHVNELDRASAEKAVEEICDCGKMEQSEMVDEEVVSDFTVHGVNWG